MNQSKNTVMEWRGKNVDDMSKAELIEALKDMQQLLQETVNQSIQDKQMLMGLII